jgi:preprotein translocase subunit SecG
MYTFLMILFIFLCVFLALFILIQQGKSDWGLGSMSGSQILFGGSGGQGFFEKTTWVLGAIFILGSLGLAILKSKENRSSILEGVKIEGTAQTKTPMQKAPTAPVNTDADDLDTTKQAANASVPVEAPTTIPAQQEQPASRT